MNKLIVVLAVLIAGCATTREYVPVALTLPDRPTLPVIKSTDLQCLSDDAYISLVKRDRLQRGHIQVLEAIIMETQNAKN